MDNLRPDFKMKQNEVHENFVLHILFGGAEGIRTLDLLNAIQTRSQLRHSPKAEGV
jgi:hypothetical protein